MAVRNDRLLILKNKKVIWSNPDTKVRRVSCVTRNEMDEAQYALHKSLIKVKSFFDPQKQTEYEEAMKAWEASIVAWNEAGAEGKEPKEPKNPFEEEAEQWIKDNPVNGLYSAIGHTDSGLHYVTLPNIVSETILEAIDKTVEEHEIRVPLGIEWITGKNWYMCH